LSYSGGADAAFDRPAHVRADSSLAWFGDWIAVIQDDATHRTDRDRPAGIAVILCVVFNQTAEGEEQGPTLSFRGLENVAYYLLEKDPARYVCWAAPISKATRSGRRGKASISSLAMTDSR